MKVKIKIDKHIGEKKRKTDRFQNSKTPKKKRFLVENQNDSEMTKDKTNGEN